MSEIVIGRKGKGELSIGYVYVPYIIKESVSIICECSNFNPSQSLKGRYAVVKETKQQIRSKKIRKILENG